MKNEKLFQDLVEKGFVENSENELVMPICSGYSIVTEFYENGDIGICNFYKDEENKFDSGRRFVVFSGKCCEIELYAELIFILNIEDCAKSIILPRIVSHCRNCDYCNCKH